MTPSNKKTEVGGVVVDDQQPWRTENLGRLLLHALNSFEQRVIAALQAEGFAFTRQVHLNIVRHVDREGTRMSHLASRLGITNGATTQAVDLCVGEGLVTLSIDADDKRVRKVSFTKKGKRFLDVVHACYDQIEADTRETIGEPALRSLRKSLVQLQPTKRR